MDRPQRFNYGIDQVPQIARMLTSLLPHCAVMTFSGPLGAGKTTLIREILHNKGVHEHITSPTFNYVNSYKNLAGEKFYHFDLYRITSLDMFCSMGFDEYLYQPKSWAFIEWPEPIAPLLTHDVINITLEYQDDMRIIEIEPSIIT